MFAFKKNGILAAVRLALLLLFLPGAAFALPVAVEQVDTSYPLERAAFYLIDDRGDIGILEASSPLRQNNYFRLEGGIPLGSGGALWLRFSLIRNSQGLARSLPGGASGPLFLDLGPGLGGARLYVAENVSADGRINTWRESLPLESGHFILPEPDTRPLTIYARLPGIPGLWFEPLLTRGDMDSDPITWRLLLQVALGLALVVMLARGMAGGGEWRFWAGAVLVCAIIPTLFGQYGSEPHIIYLTAMPRLLAPGLAIMLMPHLGRHLLNSLDSKPLDYTLIGLSLPGVLTALAPLVPGLGWTARLLPLAPLLLLPLILISLARVRRGQGGAALYLFFNLFPCIGAALALATLLSPAFRPLLAVGPDLTALGYLAGGLILALGRPASPKEKGDFFPLNEFLDGDPLTVSPVGAGGASEKDSGAVNVPLAELVDGLSLSVRQPAAAEAALGEKTRADKKNLADIFGSESASPGLDMEIFLEQAGPEEPGTAPAGAAVAEVRADAEGPAEKRNVSGTASLASTGGDAPAEPPGRDGQSPSASLADGAGAGGASRQASDARRLRTTLNAVGSAVAHEADGAGAGGFAAGASDARRLRTTLNAIGSAVAPEADGAGAGGFAAGASDARRLRTQDKDIIYVNDEEEPGLVLLKTAGHTPIGGLAPVHPAPVHNWEYAAISRLENALRAPYEQLVNQLDDIRSRQELAVDYTEGLEKSLGGLGLMLDNLERLARGEPIPSGGSQTIFNLAQLIRRIHEELLPLAEERGIALSWFVAPGLPAYFKGMEQEIAQAVKFLVQGTLGGALDRAAGGAVQLSVRQGAGAYSGQIQFSLHESGMRPGHMQRPSGWLNKAWELAASSGGSFNIDFIQNKGLAITLALPLTPVQAVAGPDQSEYSRRDQPGGVDLAEFAPGPEPEGAEEPIPGLPSIEEEDADEVLLLTDAIVRTEQTLDEAPAAEEQEADAAPVRAQPDLPEPEVEGAAPEDKKIVLPASDPIMIFDDDLLDIPASLRPEAGAAVPAAKPSPEAPRAAGPQEDMREYIVIADMAASGRRLLARRLAGLPYKLVEARNADDIVYAVARHPVGLIIMDADMPEADLKKACAKVDDYNLSRALPATPSLCILSHESQAERMARFGCTETQIKSASREQFRQAVLRLCPHPLADPAESLPESPPPRVAAEQSAPEAAPEQSPVFAAPGPEPGAKQEKAAKERIPMLDMIVASLDTESGVGQNAKEPERVAAKSDIASDPKLLKQPYPILSSNGDYMEAEMVPLIPGLLTVLEDSLSDLSAAVLSPGSGRVKEIAERMAGQGGTFGLQILKRMARCVEQAADAGDAEAVRDFSDELLALGRRYLVSLKETHADYLKKN